MCKYRIVAISGPSYTGSTTIARSLAEKIGWTFISAGQRFREFSSLRGVSLDNIAILEHQRFDEIIRKELLESNHAVIEGRYVGLFAQGTPDILKVLVAAEVGTRQSRCLLRESSINSRPQAEELVANRDKSDQLNAEALGYGQYFLAPSLFDLVVPNETEKDVDRAVAAIIGAL